MEYSRPSVFPVAAVGVGLVGIFTLPAFYGGFGGFGGGAQTERDKEVKRCTLLELVEYINSAHGQQVTTKHNMLVLMLTGCT